MAVKIIIMEALERHCASGETGRLDLRRQTYEGHIYMANKLLVHAELAGLDGVPALFRLFDWGDAETAWTPAVTPEQPSLHLPLAAASVLYAEHLRERASLEAQEKEKLEQELGSLELIAGQAGGVESILKHYTVAIECSDPTLLPDGFRFADANKSSYVIGSSEDCDVIIRHPSVEALHCGVILEKGTVKIWDLGAQSGVKLNGVTIGEGVLKVGDIMTLGVVDLHVHFLLRRPNLRVKPAQPAALPANTTQPLSAPPSKIIPKGAITYDKVSKQLKGDKAKPFLAKLGSLFGSKGK